MFPKDYYQTKIPKCVLCSRHRETSGAIWHRRVCFRRVVELLTNTYTRLCCFWSHLCVAVVVLHPLLLSQEIPVCWNFSNAPLILPCSKKMWMITKEGTYSCYQREQVQILNRVKENWKYSQSCTKYKWNSFINNSQVILKHLSKKHNKGPCKVHYIQFLFASIVITVHNDEYHSQNVYSY